jgi:hypothetical protein
MGTEERQMTTLIIDSGEALATRLKVLRPRKVQPRGIVIHTTGAGPWNRWQEHPDTFGNPYAAARYVYERISKEAPHYLVDGEWGIVCKLVDPMTVAWHVGSAGAWKYKLPGWAKPYPSGLSWFRERFPGCRSPRDLLGGSLWRDGSANELTIGIEVAPPRAGAREAWTPAAWSALRMMVRHLGDKYGIPLDPYHVITHSDAHPLARVTKAGLPWDPGPSQWKFGEAVERLALKNH